MGDDSPINGISVPEIPESKELNWIQEILMKTYIEIDEKRIQLRGINESSEREKQTDFALKLIMDLAHQLD